MTAHSEHGKHADSFYQQQSFGEVNQITRMANGDLHIDFRKAEVADTVGFSYCLALWENVSNDSDVGVSHQCPSPHSWSRKCLTILVHRAKTVIPILSGNVSVGLSQFVIVLSPIFSAGRFSFCRDVFLAFTIMTRLLWPL